MEVFSSGPLPRLGALSFHLLSKLYQRRSVVITTNLNFLEWGNMFGDAKMTTALLDRHMHHCHVVETGNESWRFMQSQASSQQLKKPKTKVAKNTEQLNLSATEKTKLFKNQWLNIGCK
jgi:hypothetical protein